MVNYHQKRVRVNYHYFIVTKNRQSPSMVRGGGGHGGNDSNGTGLQLPDCHRGPDCLGRKIGPTGSYQQRGPPLGAGYYLLHCDRSLWGQFTFFHNPQEPHGLGGVKLRQFLAVDCKTPLGNGAIPQRLHHHGPVPQHLRPRLVHGRAGGAIIQDRAFPQEHQL